MKEWSKQRKIGTGVLLAILGVMLYCSGTFAEQRPWDLIKWDKPKPAGERLGGDRYVLPEGWKEATKGVKKIIFGNSGDMRYDIATQMNIMRFEQLTGIKVEPLELESAVAYAKTLSTLMARDGSIQLPLTERTALELRTYVGTGWLTPVDPIYSPSVLKAYGKPIEVFYCEGHWWGGPVASSTALNFYRPSWLQNAGVDVPDTWQEFYQAAQKCRTWGEQNLGKDYYGAVFAGSFDLIRAMQPAVYSQGGRVYKNGRYHFTSPEVKNAFGLFVDLVKQNIASKALLGYETQVEAANVFGAGKAAFGLGFASGFATIFKTQFPDIREDFDVLIPFKWSKEYPEDCRTASFLYNGVVLNKFSEDHHKAAAMLFLDFLLSKEAMAMQVVVEGNESTRLDVYTDARICEKVDWELADQAADKLDIKHPKRVTSLVAERARTIAMKNSPYVVYPVGGQKVLEKLVEEFGKVVLGKKSKSEALESVQEFAEKTLPGR